jgi:hypothetical protein
MISAIKQKVRETLKYIAKGSKHIQEDLSGNQGRFL